MKRLLVMVLFCSQVLAQPYDEDIDRNFDMKRAKTLVTNISVEYVKDVKERCEAESHRRGFGGFGDRMVACSFWNLSEPKSQCHIVVPRKASLITLGHEFAHCLFGSWH